MIKFFRHIRRTLIQENQMGKYFKYAIGEILLVVIGILIALQINNWNSNRIIKVNQLNLSKRLLAENKRNIENLNAQKDKALNTKTSIHSMLQLLTEDYKKVNNNVVDSLLFNILTSPDVDFNTSVLNEALSTGQLANYKNDYLKNILYSIPVLFDDTTDREDVLTNDQLDHLIPLVYKHTSLRQVDYVYSSFGKELGASKLKAIDNRKILAMRTFENMLDNQFYLSSRLIVDYKKLETKLKELNELLKNEINDIKVND